MNKEFFERGIEEIISEKSFKEKLKSKKKLTIKMGMDPTKPDIHLGHAVGLLRLKELQDEGHKIVCIIGDYTTKIGDPSGRNTTRPVLSDEEIAENAKTYFDQLGRILDLDKTEVRFNSEWLKNMDFNDVLQIAGKFTVAQIIERDDFENRLNKGIDIGLHELFYPLMQAYDSVVLEADVEFGGTDQKFNMLAGRTLQKKMNLEPQEIVTVKILTGLDGKDKMSKSLDNYIGLTEAPGTQFGKVMSIPDHSIEDYFKLCTYESNKKIATYMDDIKKGKNPRDIKMILAEKIVEIFNDKEAAKAAREEFLNVFSKKSLPKDIPQVELSGRHHVANLLVLIGTASSNSEARRLISQGGVKIDGVKIEDLNLEVSLNSGMIIQSGKLHYFKIK